MCTGTREEKAYFSTLALTRCVCMRARETERRAMIKIKMTYDKESEVEELLEIIKKKVEIKKMKEMPDEKRKRLCIWGEKKL